MAPEYRGRVCRRLPRLPWGEMAGLTRASLQLHQIRPQANIVGSLERFENGFRYVEETKSTSGKRLVPIPAFLVEVWAEHLAAASENEFVFTSPEGDLLHYQNWRKLQWTPAVLPPKGRKRALDLPCLLCGRCWDRTSDPCVVSAVLSR